MRRSQSPDFPACGAFWKSENKKSALKKAGFPKIRKRSLQRRTNKAPPADRAYARTPSYARQAPSPDGIVFFSQGKLCPQRKKTSSCAEKFPAARDLLFHAKKIVLAEIKYCLLREKCPHHRNITSHVETMSAAQKIRPSLTENSVREERSVFKRQRDFTV